MSKDEIDKKILDYIRKNYMTSIYEGKENDFSGYYPTEINTTGRQEVRSIKNHREGSFRDLSGRYFYKPKTLLAQSYSSHYSYQFMEAVNSIYGIGGIFCVPEYIVYIGYRELWKDCIKETARDAGVISENDYILDKNLYNIIFSKANTDKSYISLDFVFPDISLAIEIDGSQHLEESSIILDKARDMYLEKYLGIKVERFVQFGGGSPKYETINYIKLGEVKRRLKRIIEENKGRDPILLDQTYYSFSYFISKNSYRLDALRLVYKLLENSDSTRYTIEYLKDFISSQGLEINCVKGVLKEATYIGKEIFQKDITFEKT